MTGGKQPGFKFSQLENEADESHNKPLEKKNFIRKRPLEGNRLSQKETSLHKEFIFKMKKNFWY